jgi:hypothetical protein
MLRLLQPVNYRTGARPLEDSVAFFVNPATSPVHSSSVSAYTDLIFSPVLNYFRDKFWSL